MDEDLNPILICPLCGEPSRFDDIRNIRHGKTPNTIGEITDHNAAVWRCPKCGQWVTLEDEAENES